MKALTLTIFAILATLAVVDQVQPLVDNLTQSASTLTTAMQ